jgi:penicillin-binding protein 2
MSVYHQARSRSIQLLLLVVFLIILFRLFYLQVIDGRYRQLAMDNAVYAKVIYPERGLVYDRKGRAILNNSIAYDLMVTPSEVKGIDTLELCRLLEMDTVDFRKRLVEAIVKNTSVRPSVFRGLLPKELQARFEENAWKFPGFNLVERPLRAYPYDAAAHILGYVREVDAKDIEEKPDWNHTMKKC